MAPNAAIIPVKRRIVPGRYRDVAPIGRKPIRGDYSFPGVSPRATDVSPLRGWGSGKWGDNGR